MSVKVSFTREALQCQNIRVLAALAKTTQYPGHLNDKDDLIRYLTSSSWWIPAELADSVLAGSYVRGVSNQDVLVTNPNEYYNAQSQIYQTCQQRPCTIVGYANTENRIQRPPTTDCYKAVPIKSSRRVSSSRASQTVTSPRAASTRASTAVSTRASHVAGPSARESNEQEKLRQRISEIHNDIIEIINRDRQSVELLRTADTKRGWFSPYTTEIKEDLRTILNNISIEETWLRNYKIEVEDPYYVQLKLPFDQGVVARSKIRDAVDVYAGIIGRGDKNSRTLLTSSRRILRNIK